MSGTTINHVVLSNPTRVQLGAPHVGASSEAASRRSWIQLARTGSFVSKRYGKFAITKTDLSEMLHNFREITPKAPTQLPIDYDHLSMDPKKPGDGIAAGWLEKVELRENGDELWGQVSWTPDGAERIAKQEYRYVSPSFIKDHTHKDGTKIGTTLLAAAITNHPFLEGMQAVTLYNFSSMGDLAVADTSVAEPVKAAKTIHMAELDQRVGFAPNAELTPELDNEQRNQTFVVKSMVGEGDDQFVRLTTLDGQEFGWFRSTQLAPANAPDKQKNNPSTEVQTMSDNITIAAQRFEQHVTRLIAGGAPARTAFDLAQRVDAAGAEAYRLAGTGVEAMPEPEPAAVVSLSSRDGEDFDALTMRIAAERNIPLRDAARAVSIARPDLLALR